MRCVLALVLCLLNVAAGAQEIVDIPTPTVPAESDSWLAELRAWQTGLAALVGLIAIALTVHLNSRADRKRDDRLRCQEAKACAIELLAEARTVRIRIRSQEMLLGMAKIMGNERENFLEAFPTLSTPIHDSWIGKLGVLGPELTFKIELFFGILLGRIETELMSARQHLRVEKLMTNLEEDNQELLRDLSLVELNSDQIAQLRQAEREARQSIETFRSAHGFEEHIDGAVTKARAREASLGAHSKWLLPC